MKELFEIIEKSIKQQLEEKNSKENSKEKSKVNKDFNIDTCSSGELIKQLQAIYLDKPTLEHIKEIYKISPVMAAYLLGIIGEINSKL